MNPAECLVGKKLNDWNVIEKIEKSAASTGGFHSVGYWVCNEEGQIAFLKAMDYSQAKGPNQAQILNSMTNAYLHEASLLEKCANKKLRYIIQIKDKGQIDIDTSQFAVDCIILEKADTTARSYFDISNKIDTAMYLRSLHDIAVGLQELHTINIAHQDIKPSNVLLFKHIHMTAAGCSRCCVPCLQICGFTQVLKVGTLFSCVLCRYENVRIFDGLSEKSCTRAVPVAA